MIFLLDCVYLLLHVTIITIYESIFRFRFFTRSTYSGHCSINIIWKLTIKTVFIFQLLYIIGFVNFTFFTIKIKVSFTIITKVILSIIMDNTACLTRFLINLLILNK